MPKESIITSLDIGSTAIRMVSASINNESKSLDIKGAVEVESAGIHRGVITNIDEATSALSQCLEEMEKMSGHPVENVWVGLSGGYIISQMSKGVVAIARPNGEIQEDDTNRAVENSEMVAAPPNYENIHSLVQNYIVDNHSVVKDPIGMTGIRLEAETVLIMALSSQIKNLRKCVYRAGVSIAATVLGPLAIAEVALNYKQRELGTVLVDIGGATTKIIVFEEGNFIHAAIIPIGSIHITSDIAIGLRSSVDVAEQIKLEYGQAISAGVSKKEMIQLSEFDENETEEVSRRHVAEIIEARVEEIFSRVDQELRKIKRSGRLPAGAVLTGGGAKLPGIVELAKKELKLPVSLGYPKEGSEVIDKVNDLNFATALGLVYWAANKGYDSRESFMRLPSVFNRFSGAGSLLKRLLKF